jgi:peptidoglycan/LPS O-acetylase OafA/YrhL
MRPLVVHLQARESSTADNHLPIGRVLYLDGWRALAIGGVVIDHFATSKGLNLGRLGVELFFVLSGRLMAQILFVEKAKLGAFYYRRFSRVWPTIAALIIVLCTASLLFRKRLLSVMDVVTSLTYTYNYASLLGHRTGMIDHLWSLCVEEHTYLFLGLLALTVRRFPWCLWPVITAVIMANLVDGAISTYIWKQDYYTVFWRTDVRMASILMGAAAFMLRKQEKLRLAGIWPMLLGVVGMLLNFNMMADPLKYSLGTACLALAIANLDSASEAVKGALSSNLFVWIGTISFSLYIWQQPFAMARPHPVILRMVPLAAAAACAVSSYYLIERPARRWLNAHPPRWARSD